MFPSSHSFKTGFIYVSSTFTRCSGIGVLFPFFRKYQTKKNSVVNADLKR